MFNRDPRYRQVKTSNIPSTNSTIDDLNIMMRRRQVIGGGASYIESGARTPFTKRWLSTRKSSKYVLER